MKNTLVGRFADSRKQKKHKVKLSDYIFQDIIKATYLRDVYIEDAFIKFSKGRNNIVSANALGEAFEAYGIKQDTKAVNDTYQRLLGEEKELTATLIDIAVEDNAKRGIEEIQKSILETVNRAIKNQPENPLKEAFRKFDEADKGMISFEQFKKCIRNYLPNIKTIDAMFLAKRYCERDDDTVNYARMLDELDMLDRGLNPLMTWAEDLAASIVKAITAKSTDFETIFKKYAPGKNVITEDQFATAMKDIGVSDQFGPEKIRKFYYFIDDDKSQMVEFREMESIIKTHCTKTPQKLMDEILEELKLQMQDKRIKVNDIYRTLDDYSREELIDKKSFRKALTRDLKFHIDDIDLDFACQIYKDKRDTRSVRYSTFMDDLKQKFELTETYVVPGKVRKEPSHNVDPLHDRIQSRKDLTTPKKGDEEIRTILNELRINAHDQRLNLEREFKK